jgi:signal transduction histidine kinase
VRTTSGSQLWLTVAMAGMSVGSFATIVVGLVGSGRSALTLIPSAVFVLLATIVFPWVLPRRGQWTAYAYIVGQLVLGVLAFVLHYTVVGATLLLIVLVIQSVLVLPLPAALVVLALVPFVHVGMGWRDGIREGLGLLVASATAAVITLLFRREQLARAELVEAHARLRAYAAQAQTLAAAQERNRIARDIHDGLGHSLTVVQMQIKAARAVLPTDGGRADAMLEKAQAQAERALHEVRQSVAALRESPVAPPLPDALRALADETTAAGVATVVDVLGPVRELPEDVRESLYRAAQEGLTNVRKHAVASQVELTLDFSSEQTVRLEVRDDGDGTSAATVSDHRLGFGLIGIEERAASLGGRMTFASVPGQGSRLCVEVPA